jgi:hypothetical protein
VKLPGFQKRAFGTLHDELSLASVTSGGHNLLWCANNCSETWSSALVLCGARRGTALPNGPVFAGGRVCVKRPGFQKRAFGTLHDIEAFFRGIRVVAQPRSIPGKEARCVSCERASSNLRRSSAPSALHLNDCTRFSSRLRRYLDTSH